MRHLSRLRYHLLLALWPLGKFSHWLSKLPLFGPLLSGPTSAASNEAIILPSETSHTIPIHHELRSIESVALPDSLLTPLVEQASARTLA